MKTHATPMTSGLGSLSGRAVRTLAAAKVSWNDAVGAARTAIAAGRQPTLAEVGGRNRLRSIRSYLTDRGVPWP